MKSLLLDTHIWIWTVLQPERVGRKVREAVLNPDVVKWLSPVSTWEACLLIERGRFVVGMTGPDWVERTLHAWPLREASLTHQISLESRRLESLSQDPADRFLVATARLMELTLVTADRAILKSGACKVLSNNS